ncbi:MAG: DUF378 domain-containing protein [Clostridiales bacterium]|jgi:uncharacterized membrane protein YuzA (DUF378 family)|nr:DUF378 domain-containing protein [Clostridiales bacterium]
MIMDRIALFLVIIGALNWGSVGIFNYDVIANLLTASVSRVIFTIVGLAGIWCITLLFREREVTARDRDV